MQSIVDETRSLFDQNKMLLISAKRRCSFYENTCAAEQRAQRELWQKYTALEGGYHSLAQNYSILQGFHRGICEENIQLVARIRQLEELVGRYSRHRVESRAITLPQEPSSPGSYRPLSAASTDAEQNS